MLFSKDKKEEKEKSCKCKKKRVLFLLKDRIFYGGKCNIGYGLRVSCTKVAEALELNGFDTKIVSVIDTNFIDREVSLYKPDFVIIEAIWAESQRLPLIFKLNSKVEKWTVRLHSKTPFLQNESQAIKYIKEYQNLSKDFSNFNVSANNIETKKELYYSLGLKSDHLPNIYLFKDKDKVKDQNLEVLDIGCFGYLRIQKNVLIQAMAAIAFANKYRKILHFHINHSQIDKCDSVYKNLVALFDNSKHRLYEHSWTPHTQFLELVSKMDICMGVSNTETFCIAIMDAIVNNVPVVVSKEVDIVSPLYYADTNEIESIISKLEFASTNRINFLHFSNKTRLKRYNKEAIKAWLDYLD